MEALISDTLNHYKFLITLLHKPLTQGTLFALVLPSCSFLWHIFQLIALFSSPHCGIVICIADIWPLQLPPEGFIRLWGKVETLKGLPFPNRFESSNQGDFQGCSAEDTQGQGKTASNSPLSCLLPLPPPPWCSAQLCYWFLLSAESRCSQGGWPQRALDVGTEVGCGESREMAGRDSRGGVMSGGIQTQG